MIKHNSIYLIGRSAFLSLFSALFLCGFLFSWLDKMAGPILPAASEVTLSQRQAIWSKFLGYSPQEHTCELSALHQDGKLIFAKQTKQILALDTQSGHIVWKRHLKHAITNSASTHQNKVFIATSEPRLFALDAQTGDVLWSYQLPHTTLAKVTADSTQAIIKTISGEIVALNAKNGKRLWQYKHTRSSMMLHTSSAPQLTQNAVLVGFPDGKLLAFDRMNGDLLWEHTVKQSEKTLALDKLDKLVDIATDPIIDNKNAVLYVSAYHGMLQCLSLNTGDIKWERPFSGYTPLALGKHLYAIDDHFVVYAFNQSDGSVAWENKTFKEYHTLFHHYHVTGPALTNQGEHLVVGDQASNLYWLDTLNGHLIRKASFRITSPILSTPLTAEDRVYAMNRRSQVAAWKNPITKPVITTTEE